MSLTQDQYRDLFRWLGRDKESGFPLIHEMAQFLWAFDTDQSAAVISDQIVTTMLLGNDLPTAADVLGSNLSLGTEFYAMPSINSTPINRLRVLADEIAKVAAQLYADSLPRNQDVFDDAKDIRESIGKMIAFAALSTPMRIKP